MRKLLYILSTIVLFVFATMSNVYAIGNEFKQERYAFAATWVIFLGAMLATYIVWKKRSRSIKQHATNFKVKTYEIISHGKRMVVTKKINTEPAKK
ncbi:MAG: hypothetical protein ACJ75J_14350 [Cytophagaceae bacterium]